MMSITTPYYGNTGKVTMVLFGKGTVSIVNAEGDDHKALLMRSNPIPKKIGEEGEHTPTSDDFKPEVVIAFTNEESFAVFEEFVAKVRRDFDHDAKQKQDKEQSPEAAYCECTNPYFPTGNINWCSRCDKRTPY